MNARNQEAVLVSLLAPQGITDGATVTANLDTVRHTNLTGKANYATVIVPLSAEETTHAANSTLSILESDDTVVTNFATIVANVSLDLTSAHVARYEIDLRKRKRYLRISLTAGTTTGGNITAAAVAMLHNNAQAPGSTTEMGGDTVNIV